MSLGKRAFSWKPDLPDQRDYTFTPPQKAGVKSVDLRSKCPPIYEQGALGSCTGNAIAAAMEFDLLAIKHDVMPSRLFIYYNERAMEGTVPYDAGAMIRDGIKSVANLGAPSEKEWPYSDKDPGPYQTKPPAAIYKSGLKHKVSVYQRVNRSLADMKACLAAGFPFVFGFTVYDSFVSQKVANTGTVQMPTKTERVLGGHAVMAVGFNDTTSRFIVRNSWGVKWGQFGYFTMPYDYLLNGNLSDDFWTIRTVLG
jgi:C1A family cysteine protease